MRLIQDLYHPALFSVPHPQICPAFPFLKRLHIFLPDKDVWLYTGYSFESVSTSPLLPYVDVVVDGPFLEEEKDLSLPFRGSRNQRIIPLEKGRPV